MQDVADVVEDRPRRQLADRDRHVSGPHELELVRLGDFRIGADERPDLEAHPCERERGVGDSASEPPAARVVGRDVA